MLNVLGYCNLYFCSKYEIMGKNLRGPRFNFLSCLNYIINRPKIFLNTGNSDLLIS